MQTLYIIWYMIYNLNHPTLISLKTGLLKEESLLISAFSRDEYYFLTEKKQIKEKNWPRPFACLTLLTYYYKPFFFFPAMLSLLLSDQVSFM